MSVRISLEALQEPGRSFFIYGPAGTGKTFSLRTAPRRLFLFDFDGSLATLTGEKQIEAISYAAERDKRKVWKGFQKDWEQVIKEDYRAIAIDSLTTLQDAIMAEIMHLDPPDSSKAKKYPMLAHPELKHWYSLSETCKKLFNDMVAEAQETILIVLAHEKTDEDKDTGRLLKYLPLVAGSAARRVSIYFAELYHSFCKVHGREGRYGWLTRASGLYDAKSRLASLKSVPAECEQDYMAVLEGRAEAFRKE